MTPSLPTLSMALEAVRGYLEGYAADSGPNPGKGPELLPPPTPAALDQLSLALGLSTFERVVLLATAGVELDGRIAEACATAHGDPRIGWLTFGLALAALPEPHWTALLPEGPLRRFDLVHLGEGGGLCTRSLRIDESVLHFLRGAPSLDSRLSSLLRPVPDSPALVPSHERIVGQILGLWATAEPGPIALLCAADRRDARAVLASACATLGATLYALDASELPGTIAKRETLARLIERQAALTGAVTLIESNQDQDQAATASVLGRIHSATFVTAAAPSRHLADLPRVEIDPPTTAEQRDLWVENLLPTVAPEQALDAVVTQFCLGPAGIRAVSSIAGPAMQDANGTAGTVLWDTCRAHLRPQLDTLAQRSSPQASWDDLILPERQEQLLRALTAQVHHRMQVHQRWGFESSGTRGLGISALFSGPSGTGKTFAAEVIAADLKLDLYRIDLSAVVDKYIGETEKNLRRVFDAAQKGGAVLLFDEADALFGMRSEVKDARDRHANIEVSYLLQRMETYRGLAILTSNLPDALDKAFLRRIRFVVPFGFPGVVQRAALWERAFPPEAPTEGLDTARLARLNVTGGHIRNIVLNAAFIAAEAGLPVRMNHLQQAARFEYTKLGKPLGELEGGWV